MKVLLPILLALIAAACQPAAVRDPESRWFRVPAGSVVELHEALEVPDGATRIFLQEGKVMEVFYVRQLRPHCNFEVKRRLHVPQTIQPGRFTVTRVDWGWEWVVEQGSVMVAQVAQSFDDGGSPSPISHYVHMRLDAPGQPELLRLTCHGGFDDMAEAEPPTLAEIRKALGAKATVQLP